VLDIKATLDIERYARIDVDAQSAERLYPDPALLAPEKNLRFLKRCIECFHWVNFADQASGQVYLRIERGKATFKDELALQAAMRNSDALAALTVVAPEALHGNVAAASSAEYLRIEGGRAPTLGQWGPLA
jgi:hypothetical protein